MNGKNLKTLRKERGYTQTALGKAVGATKGTVSTWETGIRDPAVPTLIKLADLLNCSIDVLLRDDSLVVTTDIEEINLEIESKPNTDYSTPTNNKPYNGWLDVMGLKEMPIIFHDAVTEKPNDGDLIIPIAFCPGDEENLEKLALSDWPWEIPCVITLPTILGNELTPVVDGAIVLWWISCEELICNLTSRIELDHMAGKAVYIAMKHLEERCRYSNNDCA